MMLSEVISCVPCGAEFHQSFLSAHVEAYHVGQRQEDSVSLACLSCAYSVSASNTNSMVQHCLVTGHRIEDVEAHFNNLLVKERNRLSNILRESYKIIQCNIQETSPVKKKITSEEETTVLNKAKPIKRRRKRLELLPEEIYKPTFLLSSPETRKLDTTLETANIKMETSQLNESGHDVRKGKAMACTFCQKEIFFTKINSNNLTKAVGHVLTHIPDLKLYKCIPCGYQTSKKSCLWPHLRAHNVKFSTENYDRLGTEKEALEIRHNLCQMFPLFKWKKSLDVLKYA